MTVDRRQLAASLRASGHIAERYAIAAFVADEATLPAPNAFPRTSVGAVRQAWRQRAAEFRSFDIEVAGLACLLKALSGLNLDEVLVQEILRAGPYTANVFHHGDGCRIVGAVLYGRPGAALPAPPARRAMRTSSRSRTASGQLDLFAYVVP
jgi:hypothetical protein